LALAVFATGCQNYDDQFDSLNKQITALTAKVDGLNPATAADISAITGQLTTLKGLVDAMTAQNITDLAAALTKIAEVTAALEALDTKVATDIAGVETSVASVTAALEGVASEADVAALSAVTDLQVELDAIKAALDGLLSAGASLKRDIVISNSAELTLAESLIDATSTADYIIEGNIHIDLTTAANFDNDLAAATTRVSALTAKVATVLGTVTSTTVSSSVALNMDKLTYVKTSLQITGKMPSFTTLATTGELDIDTDDATYSITTLVQAGLIDIDISTAVSVTSINFPNVTSTDVAATNGLGGNAFSAADATVNLGKAGLPATVVVGTLTGGGASYTTGTISTTAGGVTLSAATVSDTVINSAGDINLTGATALTSATLVAGGNISAAQAAVTEIVTMTAGSGSNINLSGATALARATLTAAGGNVNLTAMKDQTVELVITAGGVDLSAMTSNTGTLTVSGVTDLQLTAMTNNAGSITGPDVIVVNAPLLTLTATNSINTAADGTHTYASITDPAHEGEPIVTADVGALTLTNQDVAINFNRSAQWTRLSTLNITGKAATDLTAQSNAVTVGSINASLTIVTMGGTISDFTSNNSAMTALTTGGAIRNFTVSGTALAAVTFGHSSIQPGAASSIDITNTALASLNMGSNMKVEYIYISDNVTLTSITMPGASLLPEPTASISVTIHDNALTGAWTAAVTGTNTTPFVEGSFSTAPGISGAKTFITALTGQAGRTGSVSYTIEVDAASADMTSNQGTSLVLGDSGVIHYVKDASSIDTGTEVINTAAELALLND
jgi:hypothetical protein